MGDEVTQYTLSDLRTSTYDLRVAAHTSVGRGVWSAVTMVTVQVPLLPPTGSRGQSINSTSVSLSWDASPGATGYIVTYVHPDHTLGRVEIGPITSLVVTGLFPGNEYMFSLSCLVGSDESPPTVIIISLPQGLTSKIILYSSIRYPLSSPLSPTLSLSSPLSPILSLSSPHYYIISHHNHYNYSVHPLSPYNPNHYIVFTLSPL